MSLTKAFPRLSIKWLLAQVAVCAYLSFAMSVECREDGEMTSWNACLHYIFDARYGSIHAIVNLLWFGAIPIALNALGSIKSQDEKLLTGTDWLFFIVVFCFYNCLFLASTLFYSLFRSGENAAFQGLYLVTAIVRGGLSIPMCVALLAFGVRQIRRGEVAINLLTVSTALITAMDFLNLKHILLGRN
jgi:hypothetical protein